MRKCLLLSVALLTSCLTPPEDGGPMTGTGGQADAGTGGAAETGSGSGGHGSGGEGSGGSRSGGASGGGGAVGSGGSASSGGISGSGGAASGGTTGSGGDAATGGMTAGGGRGSGGVNGSGGAVTGSGGRSSAGGAIGTGGRGGTGGVVGGGGAIGSGGSSISVCTSGKTWTSGNGAQMRPGNDCKACHSFTIAGTIYPTAHEPNNCDGTTAAGVTVVVTGADGTVIKLTPNSPSGNFYSSTALKTPFTAKVTNTSGGSRAMMASQTAGNCNSCHTQAGSSGAPGRIMAP